MATRTLTRYNPQVWTNEIVLDEYDVRGVLLRGAERTAVWDTLSHPDDMLAYLPLLSPERPLDIVYSHADWDHIWGTGCLPHETARIIGHTHCLERFSLDVPQKWEKMASAEARYQAVKLIPPTVAFEKTFTIDLGGLTLELHHLPGHTPDCLVGFVPEYGLLLAGDTVETPFPVIEPTSPVPAWIAELRRWADDERIKTVIPSHGPIGGRELIQNNIAYLQAIVDGSPLDPVGKLEPFYKETHQANCAWQNSWPTAVRADKNDLCKRISVRKNKATKLNCL